METLTVSATNLAWRVLESYQINPKPFFQELNLKPEHDNDLHKQIPVNKAFTLWQIINQSVKDKCWPLRVAELWHPSYTSALGYAWQSSKNLKTAFELMERYIHIVGSHLMIKVEETESDLIVTVIFKATSQPLPQQLESVLLILVKMCRLNNGDTFHPKVIHFSHGIQGCKKRYQDFFHCEIHEQKKQNQIILSKEMAYQGSPGDNPELLDFQKKILDNLLKEAKPSELSTQVRNLIIERLPSGKVRDTEIASEVYMSTRTLQRKLKHEKITFRELLTDTRHQLANEYLKSGSHTITEIAFLLGYSEVSAFSRAYRQWTGHSPNEVLS